MCLKVLRYLSFSLFAAVLPALAFANDTMVTLGAGGLVSKKSSEISMESEDLQISIQKISIKYVFRNNSTHDIDTTVAFPLPELDGGTVYNEPMNLPDLDNLNFITFKVFDQGKEIPVKIETRAFQQDKEITSRLRSIGLPTTVLLKPLDANLLKLSPDQRTQLEKEEFIVPGEFNPPLQGSSNQGWWANWSMHVQYYWTQHFPAGKTIELVQTYRPVVGGSYITLSDDGSSSIRPYCGDASALEQIKSAQTENPITDPSLHEKRIQYILTTAKNWSGPIRNFRLSIDSDSPDDIMLTCFSGIKKISPIHYEANFSNFRPDRDLDILILQKPKQTQ